MSLLPFIRVVVLNYDGGSLTIDCLKSVVASDWPKDRMEIVLVDNGSLDDVVARVTSEFPTVRIIEPLSNTGFAGGCNLGINAPGQWDHVALVNNDATVDAGWLRAMVPVLDSADDIGAVNAKILFAEQYHGIELALDPMTPAAQLSGATVGLGVAGVRIDGRQVDERVAFDEGFYPGRKVDTNNEREVEITNGADGDGLIRWTRLERGAIRIEHRAGERPTSMSFQMVSPVPRRVALTSDVDSISVDVGPRLQWVDIAIPPEPFDVINNVGSQLFRGGYGGDRGFLERDRGQFETPVDVFAWCGAAVLMKRRYVEQVGTFDERLFLYYEDTDLSWRGQLAGWRYVYVPSALVRHHHAASSGVNSPVFRFHTERNRLLVNIKLAPVRQIARVLAVEARLFARLIFRDLLLRTITLHPPVRVHVAERWRIIRSIAKLAPGMWRDRRSMKLAIRRQDVLRWEATK